jgi:very-short-patch-repair endonuclease
MIRVLRGTYVGARAAPGTAGALSFGTRLLAARSALPTGAVFCGDTALWVHGVEWFAGPDAPIEIALPHGARIRSRPELLVRARSLHRDDVAHSPWGLTTSVGRTAYDVARTPSLYRSVPRLDALARVTRLDSDAVLAVVARNPGARWIRRVHRALDLTDSGAESPRESELRIALTLEGFPRLETQIVVHDGRRFVGRFDMGWRTLRILIEYDGQYHDDPRQFAKDRQRLNGAALCGWLTLTVDKVLFAQRARLMREVARTRSLAQQR